MLQTQLLLVSENASRIKRALLGMVLASASELRAVTGLSRDQMKAGMWELIDKGMVNSAELGCLLPGVRRYWLTARGLSTFPQGRERKTLHLDEGLGNFLRQDLTKVEAVNSISSRYPTGEWEFMGTTWYRGEKRSAMTAVVSYWNPERFESAYLPICFFSMLETQAQLAWKLELLPQDLQAEVTDPGSVFHPGGVCLVAPDEWSATQGLHEACRTPDHWIAPRQITAWYYSQGSWHVCDGESARAGRPTQELPALIPTEASLLPVENQRQLGRVPLDTILRNCPWTGRGGQRMFHLLTLVGTHFAASLDHLKVLMGEGPKGKETERRLRTLLRRGWVDVVDEKGRAVARRLPAGVPVTISDRGQGRPRYGLTTPGETRFLQAHGGSREALRSQPERERFGTKKWSYRHRDGVLDILVQFYESGCPVVTEWRVGKLPLRGKFRIEPDCAVLIRGPFGRDWHYLEFELSKGSLKAVRPRCRKYGSPLRRDSRPLLVVCLDDAAEGNFQTAGAECDPPLRMLTTTLRRLREKGVFGETVWSNYGYPVTLFAP